LRQYDQDHALSAAETQALGRFPLAAGHRLDAATPDLAEVSAGLYGQRERRGKQGGYAVHAQEIWSVETDTHQHQQGSALDQLNIRRRRKPDRLQRRDSGQGDRHSQHACKNKGQAGQQQRAPSALNQVFELLDIHARLPYRAVPSLRRRTKTTWPTSQNTPRTKADSTR